jgi:2-polyprenyl-3-methyl-5-hydroxy-6-metoxy-1,4-benzoquinol methylase
MHCPVCGYGKVPLEEKLPEVSLYYCNNCSHRFSDLNATRKKEDYSEEYYVEKHKKWFENPNIELFSYLHDKIIAIDPKASVLDIGCGEGAFLRYLSERSPNLKLTGIDFRDNCSTKKIQYYKGDIFDIKFEDKFDAVVNLAVIEHVWDVRKFTRRLTDLCRKDGLIATMTVNDQSMIYRISRIVNKIGLSSLKIRLYEKHHLNHFSKNSLRYLFDREGLHIEHHHFHVPKLNAIDIPSTNIINKTFQSIALGIFLILEKLSNQTLLQTIIIEQK